MEIENQAGKREAISRLVQAFYAKVRQDEMLGPIFNSHIPDEKWPQHLEKLTDFWETNLYGKALFKGNPGEKHVAMDRNLNYTTDQKHFGKWLQLWFETIDECLDEALGRKAKEAARRMAHAQFMVIWNHRPEDVKKAWPKLNF